MLEENCNGNSFHDDEVTLQKNEKEQEKTVSKQSAKPHQNQKNLSTTSNPDFIVSSRRLENLEKKVDEILSELKKPRNEDSGKCCSCCLSCCCCLGYVALETRLPSVQT